jgi:FkbM family methyltransferase
MRSVEIPDTLMALPEAQRRRVLLTLSCRDCDPIPKVPEAGQGFESEQGAFQVMHNGTRVLLGGYHGDWMSMLIQRLRGHHEPQEELAFDRLLPHLPPGSTMIELGGFWAYYSLWFNARVPGARNFILEPDPEHLEVGRRNFNLNGRQAVFLPYAIGESSDETAGFRTGHGQMISSCARICVDDLLARHGIDRVTLLHADIQGAEYALLRGARSAIRDGRIRFVFLSTHHESISGDPDTHGRCLSFLRDHGAHLLTSFTVDEGYGGDGLLVASFDPADRGLGPIHVSRNQDPSRPFWPPAETPRPASLLTRGLRKVLRWVGGPWRKPAA